MWISKRRVAVGASLALAGVVIGCSSDRLGAPQTADYVLFTLGWDLSPSRSWMAVMDTEVDTAIGVIPNVGTNRATALRVSADGRYIATVDVGEGFHLFDALTLRQIGQQGIQGMEGLEFLPGSSRIIARPGLGAPIVYNIPALSVDTNLPDNYGFLLPLARASEAVVVIRPGDVLQRISTESWAVLDSFTPVSPRTGGVVSIEEAVLTPDDRRLFALGVDGFGFDLASRALFAFDLQTHSCLYRTPVVSPQGSMALSHDASELWLVQGSTDLGYVLIIEVPTGNVTDTIHTADVNAGQPGQPFPLGSLAIHPTASKAYLSTGYWDPSILVINTESREIDTMLHLGPLYDLAISER